MLILERFVKGEAAAQQCHYVVLFGIGLIGSSIHKALLKSGWRVAYHLASSWDDTDALTAQLAATATRLGVTGLGNDAPHSRIDIVWAAGRAGFGESEEVFAAEWSVFARFSHWLNCIGREWQGPMPVAVHLMSSAGGLFEGQTLVDINSKPDPQRPYGEFKLRQEECLLAMGDKLDIRIYRPSTVYGYRKGGRAGLINTLIANALKRRVSKIYGSPHTLRDYIWSDDIGRYIANQIGTPAREHPYQFLVSGKSTPLREVLVRLEQIIGKPVYLRYQEGRLNASNNTFRQSLVPHGLNAVELSVGMRDCMRQMPSGMN